MYPWGNLKDNPDLFAVLLGNIFTALAWHIITNLSLDGITLLFGDCLTLLLRNLFTLWSLYLLKEINLNWTTASLCWKILAICGKCGKNNEFIDSYRRALLFWNILALLSFNRNTFFGWHFLALLFRNIVATFSRDLKDLELLMQTLKGSCR